jgi:hypothetical protein
VGWVGGWVGGWVCVGGGGGVMHAAYTKPSLGIALTLSCVCDACAIDARFLLVCVCVCVCVCV